VNRIVKILGNYSLLRLGLAQAAGNLGSGYVKTNAVCLKLAGLSVYVIELCLLMFVIKWC